MDECGACVNWHFLLFSIILFFIFLYLKRVIAYAQYLCVQWKFSDCVGNRGRNIIWKNLNARASSILKHWNDLFVIYDDSINYLIFTSL